MLTQRNFKNLQQKGLTMEVATKFLLTNFCLHQSTRSLVMRRRESHDIKSHLSQTKEPTLQALLRQGFEVTTHDF